MEILKFEDVWKGYGEDYVLREVGLRVYEGDLVAVVGPNGSGKTTLLRLAAGLLAPSRGSVLVGGIDARRPEAKRFLGLVPHQPLLYPDLTARENLVYYAGLHGLPDLGSVEPLIERLELGRYMDRRISELSYGWRKRVDFVRALIHTPKLLLLDEPLSGLDERGRGFVIRLLRELTERGIAVIYTTPNPADVIGGRVARIEEGRVLVEIVD